MRVIRALYKLHYRGIQVLAEELVILDGESPLWCAARPLLEAALLLEQRADSFTWHGWKKGQIDRFLQRLPEHCSLLVGVWQEEGIQAQQEELVLGCVCEVKAGEVRSIRTFAALTDQTLPPVEQLEPGYQHALDLMRAARIEVAPVAWALFTDKATWDEWLFAEGDENTGEYEIDKGALLAAFASQGRCVLMGSQSAQQHYCL